MSGTGERLREERERLGLSQAIFGEIGGVKANAQGLYEKGERNPDAAYLAAVAAAGVDVLYVVTGSRTPQLADSISAAEFVLVERYRTMTPESKASVDRVADALAHYTVTK